MSVVESESWKDGQGARRSGIGLKCHQTTETEKQRLRKMEEAMERRLMGEITTVSKVGQTLTVVSLILVSITDGIRCNSRYLYLYCDIVQTGSPLFELAFKGCGKTTGVPGNYGDYRGVPA